MSTDGAITFFVPGVPAPGGSKRPVRHGRTGKILLIDDCARNAEWRARVAGAARRAMRGRPDALSGPLVLECHFVLPRPRRHYGTGRNAARLKPTAPRHPTVKPDCTKLIRSCEDAMTLICWHDDAQVVAQHGYKAYGEIPGARVSVRRLGDGDGNGEGGGDGAR